MWIWLPAHHHTLCDSNVTWCDIKLPAHHQKRFPHSFLNSIIYIYTPDVFYLSPGSKKSFFIYIWQVLLTKSLPAHQHNNHYIECDIVWHKAKITPSSSPKKASSSLPQHYNIYIILYLLAPNTSGPGLFMTYEIDWNFYWWLFILVSFTLTENYLKNVMTFFIRQLEFL